MSVYILSQSMRLRNPPLWQITSNEYDIIEYYWDEGSDTSSNSSWEFVEEEFKSPPPHDKDANYSEKVSIGLE